MPGLGEDHVACDALIQNTFFARLLKTRAGERERFDTL